jgi:NADPH:quinone reductase-like Zn-dependent oxidoreductase
MLVDVTTAALERVSTMAASGGLKVPVGERLPPAQASLAHEMLAGRPHRPGKIVLL